MDRVSISEATDYLKHSLDWFMGRPGTPSVGFAGRSLDLPDAPSIALSNILKSSLKRELRGFHKREPLWSESLAYQMFSTLDEFDD